MHTTICAFDERADAEQAVELLVQAGFPRYDMHVEHRDGGLYQAPGTWGSRLPPEVRGDGSSLQAFGHFMATLLGEDEFGPPEVHGSYVLVVDARDAAQAQLVRRLLRSLEADDLQQLDREEQHPPGLRYADQHRDDDNQR